MYMYNGLTNRIWAKLFFLYHVPSATDSENFFFKPITGSNFRYKDNVYNLYFHDQMVVHNIYGLIAISDAKRIFHENPEI